MVLMKKSKGKSIGVIIFLIITFVCSLLGFFPVLGQKSASKKYSSWMSKLDDNKAIREIAIPGTHDSGSLFSFAGFTGQCQSLSLMDQLELGVRFLDIRLELHGDSLIVCHGFTKQNMKFQKVDETVVKFLKEHPKETIFMSIKNEESSTMSVPHFEEVLKKEMTKDYYDLRSILPENIGEIRGKCVLLSRYSPSTIGIPLGYGWSDNTTFTFRDIYIQDYYRIADIDSKKEAITKCFEEEGHALKINFLSAYIENDFPVFSAANVSKIINPWITDVIKEYSDKNIVLFDFITDELMDSFFGGNV